MKAFGFFVLALTLRGSVCMFTTKGSGFRTFQHASGLKPVEVEALKEARDFTYPGFLKRRCELQVVLRRCPRERMMCWIHKGFLEVFQSFWNCTTVEFSTMLHLLGASV